MNQVRTFLLFALLLLGFMSWEAWQLDYAVPARSATDADTRTSDQPEAGGPARSESGLVPQGPELNTPPPAALPQAGNNSTQPPVVVESDLLRLTFDPQGATLLSADLLDYSETTKPDAAPVRLLNNVPGQLFHAQAGWVAAGAAAPTHQALFALDGPTPAMAGSADLLEVPFVWTDAETGRSLRRTWIVQRGSYVLTLRDEWSNPSDQALTVSPYWQLLRDPPPPMSGGFTNPAGYSYVGAAWFSPALKFNKIKFDDFDPKQTTSVDGNGGWVAMLQHYFFAAWIPPADKQDTFSAIKVGEHYLVRATGDTQSVAAGATQVSEARLYVGPKLQEEMAAVAPGLERTIDYGVLTVLAEPLFWLLSWFHWLVGNWGWAIVLLVLLIKAAFFKLSEAQYKSFARMRAVQPRIEALKERYGDDRTKFNTAMMELYKKEKINPMGGCLPMLVQIPVFISLYWVLLESVELRHAPWFGWIQNLSAPDPYFILPVLNLLTMVLTQKLSPAPGMDPVQRRMMQAMPLVFGVLFAFFPAGLVLYWTVNGGLGLLQQWIITRRHGGTPAKAA